MKFKIGFKLIRAQNVHVKALTMLLSTSSIIYKMFHMCICISNIVVLISSIFMKHMLVNV